MHQTALGQDLSGEVRLPLGRHSLFRFGPSSGRFQGFLLSEE